MLAGGIIAGVFMHVATIRYASVKKLPDRMTISSRSTCRRIAGYERRIGFGG
jgi:hypothetical protein